MNKTEKKNPIPKLHFTPLSSVLAENENMLRQAFAGAQDIVFKTLWCGKTKLLLLYGDNMVNNDAVQQAVLTNLMQRQEFGGTAQFLQENAVAVGEIKQIFSLEEAMDGVLVGDTVLLAEGDKAALQITTKGWPNRGVGEAKNEVSLQGARDAFTEVGAFNIVLVRRRIRDPRLQVQRMRIGRRSKTDVAILYLKDVVRQEVLAETCKKLKDIDVDAVYDGGQIQQWVEKRRWSPFPTMQLTERPDKTASAICEGRIAILTDNSPFALLVPATLNVFFQAADDYYARWEVMSFTRLLRFIAAALAAGLPGLYVALAVYHPDLIPTALVLKIAEGRANVPFPTVVEVLLMEFAFELLREAGIRLPSPVSSTIGVVGGIVIGQSAVEAGLVGPAVVILAALSGICSFAVPNLALVNALRLVKLFLLMMADFFVLFGFWVGGILLLVHLASLESFVIPYLYPFCGGEKNGGEDWKDSLWRVPLHWMKQRPIFARQKARRRIGGK